MAVPDPHIAEPLSFGSLVSCLGMIDGGPWQTMARFKYKSSPIDKPHHWRLVTDTTKLGPGRHTIQAHVTWPDGRIVVEKETFLVAD